MQSRSAPVPILVYRADSWTKVSNIIFVDAPINAAFSYCREGDAYNSSDTQMISQIVQFIRKWLDNHTNFKSNPFYVGGDSCSGLIVPAVTLEIAKEDEFSDRPFLNLKGYIAGNPVTDDNFDFNVQVPFAHGMGLISDELHESAKRSCGGVYLDNKNFERQKNIQAFDEIRFYFLHHILQFPSPLSFKFQLVCSPSSTIIQGRKFCTKDINESHILEANYPLDSPKPEFYARGTRDLSVIEESAEVISSAASTIPSGSRYFGYLLSPLWANSDTVRLSLGIRKGSISRWKRCKRYDASWYNRDIESAVPYHLNLTTRGYRALVYSGDHDMVVPYIATQAWIRHLNFSIVDDWRPWYVTGQVAGYTRIYSNNPTFATVKGAGHTAPEFRPKECFSMFQRWIDHHAL